MSELRLLDDRRTLPIGVFDSGVGGLTVLHELLVWLPHEDFVYLGDTARFPYGERSRDELERFALQIAQLLVQRGAKLLVVACNAATAAALPALESRLSRLAPELAVLGVVGPGCRLASNATASGRIGLLGTTATVLSGAYKRGLRACSEDLTLTSVACPDLAPIVQAGFPFDQRVVDTVRGYCRPLRSANVDTVILGCTHYPLVAPMLQRSLGPAVRLIAAGAAVAGEVQRVLDAQHLTNPRPDEGDYRFLCTGDVASFRDLGTRFLQMPLGEVEHVDLDAEMAA
ncbi:MAG TPA: glutamate racemase [Solirubrobacteraceae bacterium]|nr:glutamate racemase [Solirubrobacteraceae bacterium]